MAKAKFKVGDKVKIVKGSEYDEGIDSNPSDTVGVIEALRTGNRYLYSVKWPRGSNNYRPEDLTLAESEAKPETYEVDEDFIRKAHSAACSEWKQKLEAKFPTVFVNPYMPAVNDPELFASIGDPDLFVKNQDGQHIKMPFALIWGIANERDVPTESKGRGLFFNGTSGIKPVVQKRSGGGYIVLFEKASNGE